MTRYLHTFRTLCGLPRRVFSVWLLVCLLVYMLLGQSLALAANACVGMSVANNTYAASESALTSDMESGVYLEPSSAMLEKSSNISAMSAHCQAMAKAMQHHTAGDMVLSHSMNSGVISDIDSAADAVSTSFITIFITMSMDCGDSSESTACDHCQNSGCSSSVMALDSGAVQHWNGAVHWVMAPVVHYSQQISSLFKPPIILS